MFEAHNLLKLPVATARNINSLTGLMTLVQSLNLKKNRALQIKGFGAIIGIGDFAMTDTLIRCISRFSIGSCKTRAVETGSFLAGYDLRNCCCT